MTHRLFTAHRLSTLLRRGLPPVVLFLLVLAVWQAATFLFKLPDYLLPAPTDVLQAAVKIRGALLEGTFLTAAAALCGFASSLAAGTLAGFAFCQSRVVRSSFYPYAVFLQTVPIIAVAPLIVVWFGYGFQSVVVVSFIISLFPILANATAGLTEIDPDLIELFRLYGATRRQVLLKLRLPHAVPFLVTGAKTSAGLAVIGAIVGEFFAGYGTTRFGLGYLVLQSKDQFKTPELFAAVMASTLLGVAVFACVSAAGATILRRWYDRRPDN